MASPGQASLPRLSVSSSTAASDRDPDLASQRAGMANRFLSMFRLDHRHACVNLVAVAVVAVSTGSISTIVIVADVEKTRST